MLYTAIINPETGLSVQTTSYLGRWIINQYMRNLIGGNVSVDVLSGGSNTLGSAIGVTGTHGSAGTTGPLSDIKIRIAKVRRSGVGDLAKDLIWTFKRTKTLGDLIDQIKLTYPSFQKILLAGPQLFRGPPPNRGQLSYVFPMPALPSLPPKMPISVATKANASLSLVQFEDLLSVPPQGGLLSPGFYITLPDLNRPIT